MLSILQEILSKHGLAFGLTQAIAESPSKLRVIAAYARTRCSDLRKDFKKHVSMHRTSLSYNWLSPTVNPRSKVL